MLRQNLPVFWRQAQSVVKRDVEPASLAGPFARWLRDVALIDRAFHELSDDAPEGRPSFDGWEEADVASRRARGGATQEEAGRGPISLVEPFGGEATHGSVLCEEDTDPSELVFGSSHFLDELLLGVSFAASPEEMTPIGKRTTWLR